VNTIGESRPFALLPGAPGRTRNVTIGFDGYGGSSPTTPSRTGGRTGKDAGPQTLRAIGRPDNGETSRGWQHPGLRVTTQVPTGTGRLIVRVASQESTASTLAVRGATSRDVDAAPGRTVRGPAASGHTVISEAPGPRREPR